MIIFSTFVKIVFFVFQLSLSVEQESFKKPVFNFDKGKRFVDLEIDFGKLIFYSSLKNKKWSRK